jgi:hypothetical protein
MPSAKYVRGYLSSLGLNGDIGTALYERCNRTWGEGNWDIGPAGIGAGGVIAILPQDFVRFASGASCTPSKPKEDIEDAPVDEDEEFSSYASKKKRK